MKTSAVEVAPMGAWEYVGPVPATEAGVLFEDPWDKPDFTPVQQGSEEVSAGNWLLSSRFWECSARLLINQVDGSAILKHVGPTSMEVLGGGDSGLRPQDAYKDFIQHAVQLDAPVWAINVRGNRSYHKILGEGPLEADIKIDGLPDIIVPAGRTHAWAIAYNPGTGEAIVQTRDEEGQAFY